MSFHRVTVKIQKYLYTDKLFMMLSANYQVTITLILYLLDHLQSLN